MMFGAALLLALALAFDCKMRLECSGHGDCVAMDVCSCYDGFIEDQLVGCAERKTVVTMLRTTVGQ